MPAYLTADTLDEFAGRIRALKPDSPRKWGALDAHRMLAHVRFAIRLSLDEEATEDRSIPIISPLIGWVVFRLLPWPKGTIKVPDHFTPKPDGTFEEEQEACVAELKRFIETAEREPSRIGVHPMFGKAKLKRWSQMHARHLSHHLDQFGV